MKSGKAQTGELSPMYPAVAIRTPLSLRSRCNGFMGGCWKASSPAHSWVRVKVKEERQVGLTIN